MEDKSTEKNLLSHLSPLEHFVYKFLAQDKFLLRKASFSLYSLHYKVM